MWPVRKADKLTLSCADCLEIWEPQPAGLLYLFTPTYHNIFFSSVISTQSTWVLYELMCWLSVVVRSTPARRSLSWIQSTVD